MKSTTSHRRPATPSTRRVTFIALHRRSSFEQNDYHTLATSASFFSGSDVSTSRAASDRLLFIMTNGLDHKSRDIVFYNPVADRKRIRSYRVARHHRLFSFFKVSQENRRSSPSAERHFTLLRRVTPTSAVFGTPRHGAFLARQQQSSSVGIGQRTSLRL